MERLRHRLVALLQRVAPARVLSVAVYLLRHHRHRRGRRSRRWGARSFRRAASNSSSCGSARLRGRSSNRRSVWRRDVLDEITQAAGADNVEITLGYVGVQPSSVSDQHHLPVDRRLARRRAAGGAEAGCAAPPRRTSRKRYDADSTRSFPDGGVLVRAGGHRQPHHELWHAHPGRGRRHGTGLRRQPDVCGEGPRGTRADSGRFATCSTARRSTTRRSRSTSTVRWPVNWASPSTRSGAPSPRRPRPAASWRRTIGPTRAPASPFRCRSKCRNRG